MQRIAFLVSCLAYANHSRRVLVREGCNGQRQDPQKMDDTALRPCSLAPFKQSRSEKRNGSSSALREAAAYLVGSSMDPAAGWHVTNCGSGCTPAMKQPVRHSIRSHPAISMEAAVSDPTEAAEGDSEQEQGESSSEKRDFNKLKNAEEYEATVEEAKRDNKVEVIVFTAKWCRTCKAMVPKLKRLAEKFPQNGFHELDFDQNKDLVSGLGIKSLPFVQVVGGSQGTKHGFTCGRGKITELLKILETYGDVQETHSSPDGVNLPVEWEPYLTNVEEVGAGNFGKVFSMDLTCPDSNVTKVAMKDLARDKMNKMLMENEMAAGKSLKDFLLSHEMGDEEDVSAYCEPLLADPKLVDGHWYLPMPFCNQGEFSGIYENSSTREKFGGDKGMYGFLLHIAKGVRALHHAGWVHNDLHGRNALVTCRTDEIPNSCYASIIDLGLANKVDEKVEGARGYRYSISPEVIAMGYGEAYPDPKSDVWELGMLLWEVRFGKGTLPTRNEPDLDAVMKLIPTLDYKEAPFPELEEEPEIRNLLRGMLTQNVSERWDIDRVIAELEKVALPTMRGPHESAWLNAGCLLNPVIPQGSMVEIFGLRSASAQHLNGKSGEVVEHHPNRGTYEIKLNDGEVLNVPEIRLRLIE